MQSRSELAPGKDADNINKSWPESEYWAFRHKVHTFKCEKMQYSDNIVFSCQLILIKAWQDLRN